ncbi:LPS export ABC transporter periplasmic protein LptC [Frigidibacter sp. MR17.24]|uniref:LPS export ABC transporter periplasmic protein LptC n=1 Tax=Frigidibacter sp. MR17.24 TaxID=3127345 RepID=UPI003012C114
MAREYDNIHSRIVALLKLVLPLTALVLLSTLFLVSRRISPEDALPYADVDVAEMTRDQRLTAPRYSTLTDSGDVLTVTAATARPDLESTGRTLAETVAAQLQGDGGKLTDLVADHGRLESAEDRLYLDGNVVITTSDGMELRSQAMNMVLGTGEAISPGPVEGEAPFGTLTANAMHIYGPTDAQMADFNGDVHLVYQPSRDSADAARSDVTTTDTAAGSVPGATTGTGTPQNGDDGQ